MSERQNVTWAVYVLALLMLTMAFFQPELWDVELFKVLLQAVIISGFINMVLAFHFAANKNDEQKTDNTAKAFDAITATANAGATQSEPDVILKPGETAQAEDGK